jgi:hypothetical protein
MNWVVIQVRLDRIVQDNPERPQSLSAIADVADESVEELADSDQVLEAGIVK